jgi:energy-coupling factor transporter ATP-binding protein EcfA2
MADGPAPEECPGTGNRFDMISSVHLENYRGFKEYRLSGLGRINLLVGKNNSGKTAILEAVNLLASAGDPRVISRIARQRGEVLYDTEDRDTRRSSYTDVSHFFHGHRFGEESKFIIQSDGNLGKLEVYVVSLDELSDDNQKLLMDDAGTRAGFGLAIKVGRDGEPGLRTGPALPVTEEGALSLDQPMRFYRMFRFRPEDGSVQFISQDSLERSSMSEMWDKVATEGKEQDVVGAMKILDKNLNSIVFLSGDRPFRFESRGGILLGFEGMQGRLPLGSYGEGMRRLLALSLSLAKTQNGILLVDEIDTGLHYSIMGDMWRLVAQTAKRYNIQVFATTHSSDCVRGLDWLCRNHPALGEEVTLQKIEPELQTAVALDAEQIRISFEQDIEVR